MDEGKELQSDLTANYPGIDFNVCVSFPNFDLRPGTPIWLGRVEPGSKGEMGRIWVKRLFVREVLSGDETSSGYPMNYTAWIVYIPENGLLVPINPLTETISLDLPDESKDYSIMT